MSISFFDDLGGLFSHSNRLSLLGSLSRSSEVECNPKTNISFFEDFFFNPPKWLKMIHNGKFCQKGGLDWLKMANFGHFAGFPIFSPKMRLRLTQNGQFHLIHNFSHLLPPKHLIFGEISKIFILGGGVPQQNF